MARDATVKTVLTASDQASGPIRNFQNSLRGLQSEMSGANNMAGLLKGGIAGFAAAAGIDALQELGGAVMDFGRTGEQMSILRTSFEQTAGSVHQSSSSMLTDLKTASGGMISEQELILSANRAIMLGVADSSEEMGKLLEVAAVRGRAMGLSTSQAFNDLVTGLGRMSPMILDNLGIVTGGEAVFTAYAASIGKAADALTDAERKQALFNKVVASTDTSGEMIVSQFERMDAAIQNAKSALGELFGPAIAQIAQNLADSVTEITDAITTDEIEAAQNRLWSFGETITLLAQKIQPLKGLSIAAETTGDTAQLQQLQQELANTSTMLGVYVANYNEAAAITGAPLIDPVAIQQGEIAYLSAAEAAALLGQQQTDAAQSGRVLADIERQVAESAGLLQGAVSRAASAVDTIRGKFVQAAAAGMAASTAFANFNQFKGLETQAEKIRSGLGNLGFYEPEDIEFYVDLNTERALMSADEMIAAFEDMNTAAGSAASGGVSDLQQGLNSLQSRALGAVQAATAADIGLNLEDFLPREDAVNENVRRLAAIMRDGVADQEWLDEFRREVPQTWFEILQAMETGGDVQGVAARILSQFQMGFRPELLDLGAIKEKIKNEIAGETAMQATAMQITAELVAETGGDADAIQRQVEQALGLAGGQIAVEALITPDTSALGDIPPVTGTVTLSPDLTALTGLNPQVTGTVTLAPDLAALTALSPEVQGTAIFTPDLSALTDVHPEIAGSVVFAADFSVVEMTEPTVAGLAVFYPELAALPELPVISAPPIDVDWNISAPEIAAISDQIIRTSWLIDQPELPTIDDVAVNVDWNVTTPELPAIPEQVIPVDWSVPLLEITQPPPVDVAVQWQVDAPELPDLENPTIDVNWMISQPELPTLTTPPVDVTWNVAAPELPAIADQTARVDWLVAPLEIAAPPPLVVDVTVEANDIQEKIATALGLGVKGAQMTDSILDELSSATFTARLETAASQNGRRWGNTFLAAVQGNVPPELISLLTDLVTPGVQARLQQQGSLTGPVW